MPVWRSVSTACDTGSANSSSHEPLKPSIRPPTQTQLKQVFVASAVPFVGFGFFDNFVMIVAGDLIDTTLCVTFCFSTMAAAAIGNTLSDVVGIYSGSVIEQVAETYGIKEPPLDSDQRLLRVTKVWQYCGQVVGIVTGCILGMCPLLWLDLDKASLLKREKELEAMLAEAMPDVQRIMKAEAVVLMGIDEEKQVLHCLSRTDNIPTVQPWSIHEGLMGHVAKTSRFVNIADVSQSQYYHPPLHDNFQGSQLRVRSLLCVPVLRAEKVVGVLTAMNKEDGGSFSEKDEDSLSFLASHIAVRMETALDNQQSFKDVVLTCEKVMAKQESFEYGSRTARQRRAELYLPALNGISRVLQAQATALMLLDDVNEELYTEAIAGDLPKHKNKLGEGLAGKCAVQGRIFNIDRNSAGEIPFNKECLDDFRLSGTKVNSALCVPLFDSGRKCLGVIKVINKQGGGAFTKDDKSFAMEVANDLAIMLEDDGGIKRVLTRVRQQIQHRAAIMAERADNNTVLCFLDRGQNLPDNADAHGVGIDPYVTIRIVRGNPMAAPNMEVNALEDRFRDRTSVVRRFGKSKTIMQNLNPHWDETIAVTVPVELRGVPEDELFVHVLLWDYDSWKHDDLVAQAAFPLATMPRGKIRGARPCNLEPIPGDEYYNLERSKLWLAFSRAGPKPLARVLTPPSTKSEANVDDWAGDTFVPRVGQQAVDSFVSSNDFLKIVGSMRTGIETTHGISVAEIPARLQKQDPEKLLSAAACAVSDPEKLDCPLVFVSKRFEELSGYPRSYCLGRNCRFLQPNNRAENDAANLTDRKRIQQFVQGLMPQGQVLWGILLNESYEGRKFWNLIRMEFVYVGDERKPYVFAVQCEFKSEPKDLQEVQEMRELLAKHERDRKSVV